MVLIALRAAHERPVRSRGGGPGGRQVRGAGRLHEDGGAGHRVDAGALLLGGDRITQAVGGHHDITACISPVDLRPGIL